jgi:hypothetical protein
MLKPKIPGYKVGKSEEAVEMGVSRRFVRIS